MDWSSLYAISATFTVFFELMWFGCEAEKIVACEFPQLITVETATIKDMHGGSLNGTYSVPLVNWLASFKPGTEITEVRNTMVITWSKIHKQFNEIDKMNTYANVAYKDGWLNISCPGDRCGLHPSLSMGLERDKGYEIL
jgi:hypothetical protein